MSLYFEYMKKKRNKREKESERDKAFKAFHTHMAWRAVIDSFRRLVMGFCLFARETGRSILRFLTR